jgi:hypothetical protein
MTIKPFQDLVIGSGVGLPRNVVAYTKYRGCSGPVTWNRLGLSGGHPSQSPRCAGS